ncbi:hypothetical protein EKO04_005404 [Ascochyta lentis]|uniref:Uncharacterized protein n=1 Tax=Ascochyta lentis TaxID=205686 RepID=A0A8H7J535_9PLEO|nr:hypothetical protein EKO04_005404 [Ascochyta lentis]
MAPTNEMKDGSIRQYESKFHLQTEAGEANNDADAEADVATTAYSTTQCAALPPVGFASKCEDEDLASTLPLYSQRLVQQLFATLDSKNIRTRNLERELEQYRQREEAQLHIHAQNIKAANETQQKRNLLRNLEPVFAGEAQLFTKEKEISETGKDRSNAEAAASTKTPQDTKVKNKGISIAAKSISEKGDVLKVASINFWAFGTAKQQFRANPAQLDFSNVSLPTDFNVDINDNRIVQLRLHDYYKGWLDSMSAHDMLQAWSEGKTPWDAIQYLFDKADTRSPLNAGRNVGMLFGWSAACINNGKPEHDGRLDDRAWGLHHISPRSEHVSGNGRDFWQGVKWGKETANGLFDLKVKSDIWQTLKDPKQVEYLKEACRQGREL